MVGGNEGEFAIELDHQKALIFSQNFYPPALLSSAECLALAAGQSVLMVRIVRLKGTKNGI